eukprot:scaffold193995_cov14-Tisochrysis_lutea.AAC.1
MAVHAYESSFAKATKVPVTKLFRSGEQVLHFRHADTSLAIPRMSAWTIQENVFYVVGSVPVTFVQILSSFGMPLGCHSKVVTGKVKERKEKNTQATGRMH